MDLGLSKDYEVFFIDFLDTEAVLDVGFYGHLGEGDIFHCYFLVLEGGPIHVEAKVWLPAGFGIYY